MGIKKYVSANKSMEIIKKIMGADGFNFGANLGKGGAGIEEHIHFHIVPRWIGDTNFMLLLQIQSNGRRASRDMEEYETAI